ncbi:MAG: AMP-binding protein, partial [Pyrinomonadaceae bacterium]
MTDKVNFEVTRKVVERIPLLESEPKTLGELFRQADSKYKNPKALNYKSGDKWLSISSEEMIERAENIALGLYSLGIRKGDRVAILSANSPNWTLTDAGCQMIGIVDVPIYTTLAPNSVKYILNDAGVRIRFLQDKEAYERIKQVLGECPSLEKRGFFNLKAPKLEDSLLLSELETLGKNLKDSQPELMKELERNVQPSDLATLIYTSG